MKSKLKSRRPATAALTLVAALMMMGGVAAGAADRKQLTNPAEAVPTPPGIDPATGLPIPPPEAPPWKDPHWKDPDKVLSDVSIDNLPLSEVVLMLRKEFKDAFDVLIPNGWRDPNAPNWEGSLDPRITTIRMHLHNVTASEIFNAMNLVFENENTPLRWELKMNGTRPTAVVRVLPWLVPPANPPPPPQPVEARKRMIYFVGDLIGDEKSGGTMTMEQLVKTVSEVYQMSYGSPERAKSSLQFHKEAQLLVVTGTPDQIAFVQQTLNALRQKTELDLSRLHQPRFAEPKVITEPAKKP